MVELLKIKTSTAIWSINGTEMRFQRRKNRSDDKTRLAIEKYILFLVNKEYEHGWLSLKNIMDTLTDTMAIRIGMIIYRDEFLKMFEYYTGIYVKKWADSNKRFITNKLTVFPVFEFMFRNTLCDIQESNSCILKCIKSDTDVFDNILNVQFCNYWRKIIDDCICDNIRLEKVCKKIGLSYTIKIFDGFDSDCKDKYLKYFARGYTKERRVITLQSFYADIFGKSKGVGGYLLTEKFRSIAEAIVGYEKKIQHKIFPAQNCLYMIDSKDKWEIYYTENNMLRMYSVDFSDVNRNSLKSEIKSYIRYRYFRFPKQKQSIKNMTSAINLLTDINDKIYCLSDVRDVDVRSLYMCLEKRYDSGDEKRSVSAIMRMFSEMSGMYKYLMSEHRETSLKFPKPFENPFEKFRFHNAKEYKVRTEVIPESVMEGIEKYLNELKPHHALMYKIFSETGMRLKEVFLLEENCLEKSRYEGFALLEYKQYKTLISRRKRGLPEYHQILIRDELAQEIQFQINCTKEWRENLKLPYIFVDKRDGFSEHMLNMGNYIKVINDLIKKHNICDESGKLWHFTSKQQRKTIAVRLIENGATVDELAYWLGHLSRNTASNYYAEVRKSKLAEMNTEFFRKKFEVMVTEEQLSAFSEEERKLLYVDFCLEQRRVEFGYCIRKLADGGCNNRNSLVNCANCKNLCTGRKYLSHWLELYNGQNKIVEYMLRAYKKSGITDYAEFREYKQAVQVLKAYKDVVESIERSKECEFTNI